MSDYGDQFTVCDLVSVILPVYNGEKFISETLNSVLSQTYKNLEIIVVDDGSEDKTVNIVNSFIQRDSRITLLRQSNSGVAAARNLAINHSKGEFIAPIDADDIWNPQKIAKQVKYISQQKSSCGLVYTWSYRIDEFGNIVSEDRTDILEGLVYPALAYCNFVGNASVPLIKRECLEKVGYYNTQLKLQNAQGCEDWDLYFRVAEHYEYGVIPEFLMGYRITSQSMSCNFNSMLKSFFLTSKNIKSKHPEIPNIFFRWSEAQFYLHFARQSILARQYSNYFKWWVKSILTDYATLFDTKNYKIFFLTLIKLENKHINNKNQLFNQKQITIKNIFSPHKIIKNRRWKKIIEICQSCKIA